MIDIIYTYKHIYFGLISSRYDSEGKRDITILTGVEIQYSDT